MKSSLDIHKSQQFAVTRNCGATLKSNNMCNWFKAVSYFAVIGTLCVYSSACRHGKDERNDSSVPPVNERPIVNLHSLSPTDSLLSLYQAAADAYALGSAERNGAVFLSEDVSPFTADGFMYVTVDPENGNCFLFAFWRGKSSNLRGFLYWPRPQGAQAISTPASVKVIGPSPVIGGTGMVEVEIVRITDNWYEASRSLD